MRSASAIRSFWSACVKPLDAESERDVVADGEMGEQRVVLKHHVERSFGRTPRSQVVVAHHDAAGRWLLETRHQPQGRGLAAPTGPEQ